MTVDIDRALRARSDDGRLRSRKNKVHAIVLDGRKYVVKAYEGADAAGRATRESAILKACETHKVPAPALLAVRGDIIVTSFLEGSDAMTVLDDGSMRPSDLLGGIAAWLCMFHDAFGGRTARGDCILKNFMVTPSGITGIDFEESSESDPVDDLGQLCASLLSSRPMFTMEKFALVNEFGDRYSRLSGRDVSRALPGKTARALEYYAEFRQDGPEMVEWARRIEQDGL